MKNIVAAAINAEMHQLSESNVHSSMELVGVVGRLLAQAVNELERLQGELNFANTTVATQGSIVQRQRDARLLLRNSLSNAAEAMTRATDVVQQGSVDDDIDLDKLADTTLELLRCITEAQRTLDETK